MVSHRGSTVPPELLEPTGVPSTPAGVEESLRPRAGQPGGLPERLPPQTLSTSTRASSSGDRPAQPGSSVGSRAGVDRAPFPPARPRGSRPARAPAGAIGQRRRCPSAPPVTSPAASPPRSPAPARRSLFSTISGVEGPTTRAPPPPPERTHQLPLPTLQPGDASAADRPQPRVGPIRVDLRSRRKNAGRYRSLGLEPYEQHGRPPLRGTTKGLKADGRNTGGRVEPRKREPPRPEPWAASR